MQRLRLLPMIVSVCAALTLLGPATAAATPVPAQIAGSVDYLTTKYHISTTEAVRRLELQSAASQLVPQLAGRFPDDYAGMWLDQEHGGILRINMVHPGLLNEVTDSLTMKQWIKPVAVRYSRTELDRMAADLNRTLTGTGTSATIDEVGNRVVTYSIASTGRPTSCSGPSCDPPMRGGVELRILDDSQTHGSLCTSGFNVRGSNGWEYLLTAGHCFDKGYTNVTSNGQDLGYPDYNALFDTYPYDGAIVPYNNGSAALHWLPNGQPKNRVYSNCNETSHCSDNELFPITGMYTEEQIGVNWIVCASGSTTLTKCGSVTNKIGSGITTDICRRDGDSGGPLFSEMDNKAYGILHGGPIGDETVDCGARGAEWSTYSPVSAIFSRITGRTGINYFIQTS